MKTWCYKWLPIIFGCHCKPERSFHFRSRPFPICARCTGELIGIVLALLCCPLFRMPPLASALLMIPMIADGTVQHFTRYESHNLTRVITGTLFGFGITMLFVLSVIAVFQAGMRWGATLIP